MSKMQTDTTDRGGQVATVQKEAKPPILMGAHGLNLTSLDDAFRFCQYMKDAGLGNTSDTPSTILAKIQTGLELGFRPMQALSSLYVVNGRVAMETAPMRALILQSGLAEYIESGFEGEGEKLFGWCRSKRVGARSEEYRTFTYAEARKAGYVPAKEGAAWAKNPGDMCEWRASSRLFKRVYPDVIRGIVPLEEAREYAQPAESRVISLDETRDRLFPEVETPVAEASTAPAQEIIPPEESDPSPRPTKAQLRLDIGNLVGELEKRRLPTDRPEYATPATATVDELIGVRNRMQDILASYE